MFGVGGKDSQVTDLLVLFEAARQLIDGDSKPFPSYKGTEVEELLAEALRSLRGLECAIAPKTAPASLTGQSLKDYDTYAAADAEERCNETPFSLTICALLIEACSFVHWAL